MNSEPFPKSGWFLDWFWKKRADTIESAVFFTRAVPKPTGFWTKLHYLVKNGGWFVRVLLHPPQGVSFFSLFFVVEKLLPLLLTIFCSVRLR
jgi:hypothetical protein